MINGSTRRDFLKLSGTGIATLAGSSLLSPGIVASEPGAAGGSEISVWTTAGDERLKKQPPLKWKSLRGQAGANSIAVEPTKSYQEILGFGAAFTDAACYTFNRLNPSAREALFHELFDPAEMGLSVCRTCVGSSDYSTEAFTYDEGDPDPELSRFSIAHDRPYVLPILREARKVNPDLFLFSSPWTPPGWMKSNKS